MKNIKLSLVLMMCLALLGMFKAQGQSHAYTQLSAKMQVIEDAPLPVNNTQPNDISPFTRFISDAVMAASYGLLTDGEYQALHQRILNQLRRKNGASYIYNVVEVENNGTIEAYTAGAVDNGTAISNNGYRVYILKGTAKLTGTMIVNMRYNVDENPAMLVFLPFDDNTKVVLKRADDFDGDMFRSNGGRLILLGNTGNRLSIDGGATYSDTNPSDGSAAALRTVGGRYSEARIIRYNANKYYKVGDTYGNPTGDSKLDGIYMANAELRNIHSKTHAIYMYSMSTKEIPCLAKSMGIYNTYFHDITLQNIEKGAAIYFSGQGEGARSFRTYVPDNNNFTMPVNDFEGLCLGRCTFERNVVKREVDIDAASLSENFVRGIGGGDLSVLSMQVQVRVTNSTFSKSFARWYGGSIFWNRGEEGSMLSLDHCTFDHCHGHIGGAIYNEGNITITNCTFNDNKAICNDNGGAGAFLALNNGYDGCGGAIFSRPSNSTNEATPWGKLYLDACTFNRNHADTDGGAVNAFVDANSSGQTDVRFDIELNNNTKLYDNTAGRCGGAIALTIDARVADPEGGYEVTTSAKLNYGEALRNYATGENKLSNECNDNSDPIIITTVEPWFNEPGDGGGFYLEKTTTTIGATSPTKTAFTLEGNVSANHGGGIYVRDADVTLNEGSIVANEAAANGGAIYVNEGDFVMNGGELGKEGKPNKAIDGNGGGVCVIGGDFTANGGSINYNQAKDGGGVSIESGSVTISNGTLIDNKASNFGGGLYVGNGNVLFNDGNIASNHAKDGAGLYIGGGSLSFPNGNIDGNIATGNGGGVYVSGGSVTFNGNISGNSALNGGGVFLGSKASMTFNGGIISGNKAKATASATAKTAYHGGSGIEGCGGGIYLQSGSDETHATSLYFVFPSGYNTFGLYTNEADKGGDDIVAEGLYTSVTLPAVSNMSLIGFEGIDANPYWYQDYFTDDDGYYKDGGHAVEGNVQTVGRFRDIVNISGTQYYEHRIPDSRLSAISGNYLCLTLSFNMMNITVTANGLLGHETALFKLVRRGLSGEKTYDILLNVVDGVASRTLRNVPWGLYSIYPNNQWNWAYEPLEAQENIRLGEIPHYEFLFDMQHKNGALVPQHDEKQPKDGNGDSLNIQGYNNGGTL